MGHIIACMINRADLLEEAVRAEQDALSTPPKVPTTAGVLAFIKPAKFFTKSIRSRATPSSSGP